MATGRSTVNTSSLIFRQAAASDAAALAPLVHAAGSEEFAWLFKASVSEAETFLRRAIARPHGRFSWKRHIVATLNDAPVAVLAIQHGRRTCFDGPLAVHDFRVSFGVRRTPSIVRRGLVLEREIPPPRFDQILIQHCATVAELRGHGIFRALFAHVQANYLASFLPHRSLVLDVLDTNERAAMLYRELGFREIAKPVRRSQALPANLTSTRMQWAGLTARIGNGAWARWPIEL